MNSMTIENHTETNSVCRKISKLLKLAKTSTEAESKTAFAKAKQLASKYDLELEMAAIQGQEVHKEPFDRKDVATYGRMPVVHKHVVHLLQDFFKVRVIYDGWQGCRTLTFVGRKNDIAIAKEVHEQLMNTFQWLWNTYKKEKGLSVTYKSTYMYGLYKGLSSKLLNEEMRAKSERIDQVPEEIRKGTRDKLELALIDERKQLLGAMEKFYPHLRKASSQRFGIHHGSSAYSDGVAAGRSINTGKTLSITG